MERLVNKIFLVLFLILALGAFIGVLYGATHQLFIMFISLAIAGLLSKEIKTVKQ